MSSDTVARGITLTGGEPGLLVDVHHQTDTGWAASLAVTAVEKRGPPASSVAIAAVSRGWQFDDAWSMRAGLTHYAYPGGDKRFGAHDYNEVFSAVDWKGRVSASIGIAFDASYPTMAGRVDRFVTCDLNVHQRLVGRFGLDAGIGYVDFGAPAGRGYSFHSVGLSWGIGDAQLFITRLGSNAVSHRLTPQFFAGTRWVASLIWNF